MCIKNNINYFIFQFSVFLLLIFIAELAVGIAGYVKHTDLETSIVRTLNESITRYSSDPDIKKNYDIIQTDVSLQLYNYLEFLILQYINYY